MQGPCREANLEELAVKLDNIKKYYGRKGSRRKAAVEDISLEVRTGEIFGLLGPNGAGKTTTLKVMLGLVYPDGGNGALLGRPLGDRTAHRRVGFLPEQPYFYSFLTAEKALDFYGNLFNLAREERATRSAELLDLVGLGRGSHLTLDKYSKGMLQRFGIAQALVNDPDLVILDEPSGGLDPVGQKEVRDILLQLKEKGRTIFLSSHLLSEVENICDCVSIVNRGKVVRTGSLEGLLAAGGLKRITLRGNGPELAERLSGLAKEVLRQDDLIMLDVEDDDVYPAIDAARELGLEVVSLAPSRRSLEELFLEAVRGGEQ